MLRYQTEPLAQAVEIAGNVEAELTVSTDAEHTDFMVKLVNVYPNGYQALVLDQAYRLRYHAGFDKATPVEKNKPYTIKVNPWPTALVFKGHRIAVHVSSSNAPRFERHTTHGRRSHPTIRQWWHAIPCTLEKQELRMAVSGDRLGRVEGPHWWKRRAE